MEKHPSHLDRNLHGLTEDSANPSNLLACCINYISCCILVAVSLLALLLKSTLFPSAHFIHLSTYLLLCCNPNGPSYGPKTLFHLLGSKNYTRKAVRYMNEQLYSSSGNSIVFTLVNIV